MQLINDLARRIRYVYDLTAKIHYKQAKEYLHHAEWGIKKNENLELLKELGVFYTYLGLLEWKAWEQNTFYLECDDNDCPIWQYPSTVVDQKLMECIIDHFQCKHIDLRNVLRKFGVLPYDTTPDGIDYMHVEEGIAPCSNRLWQINKPYGTDSV